MTSIELKHQAQLQEWASAIKECRSSGRSVREWCRQQGINGQTYQAFFPAETEGEDEDDPDNGLVILKVIHENGEDLLSTLDSDEELDAVYDLFVESLFDEDESEQ